MARDRKPITVKELREYLTQFPDDLQIMVAPSVTDPDEPEETQEFIMQEDEKPLVAIESTGSTTKTSITLGYAD